MKRPISLIAGACVLVAVAALAISAAAATASSASQSGALPTVSITMDGKSISVGGTLESGAVDIHSTVSGKAHASPTLVRLNPGVTADQFFALLKSKAGQDINSVSTLGAIVFDAEAPRGTSDVQTTLQPGNYVALDTSRQKPPFPTTTFTIAPAASPAALPKASANVASIDFGFRGPGVLHTGQVVRASNQGWLVHMIIAMGVRNAAAGHQVVRLLKEGKEKQTHQFATRSFFSLADPISHGAVQQSVLKAKPGYYVLACFMDTQDGREHVELGMERLIRVVK